VRFRAPCKPLKQKNGGWIERTWCKADERYTFDTTKDDVLVAWKISEMEKNPCGRVNAQLECLSKSDPGYDKGYFVKHIFGPLRSPPKASYNFNNDTTEIR